MTITQPFPPLCTPAFGFAFANHDRAAAKRLDSNYYAHALKAKNSRFVRFFTDLPLIDVSAENPSIAWCGAADFELAELETAPIFLGVDEFNHTIFAIEMILDKPVDEITAGLDETLKLIDLRSLVSQGVLGGPQIGLLAQACSLLSWHKTHRFCARCGSATHMVDSGYRRHCPACDANHFPRTDPVVIMAVYHNDNILLGRSSHFAPNMYSALAGFVEPGETIEDAARREIYEEAGVRVGAVTYHSSQPWPFASSLMIGLIGEAISAELVIDHTELEDCRWFPSAEVRRMFDKSHEKGLLMPLPLAIAHHLVLAVLDGS